MQIKVTNGGECPKVEVIDPSDGTVIRSEDVVEGQQVIVTAVNAHSPADLEVHGPEAIPEPEAESAEAGEAEGGDAAASEAEAGDEAAAGQPGDEAEGAEAPADEGQTPAEGDGEQSQSY
jgi:hypothetical protein